ncbi:hypothetical protein PR048_001527 [Dryococelus australis]|uniref:Uncharacterized protein n=1 Tax=Dryococelus australis TaxID=614101 RepID=A0ABQ9IJ09_9NEOP|nr:hypothetical protein PR048_001527 [Dryococelus australis]
MPKRLNWTRLGHNNSPEAHLISGQLHNCGSKRDPRSHLRSIHKFVAPFKFRAGLEIEMEFILNRRNWQFQILIRDQQPSSTNWLSGKTACSHQDEPGSILGQVTPGLSQVRVVLDDAISHFPQPCIVALLHSDLISPSSALKTSLRAAQISQLNPSKKKRKPKRKRIRQPVSDSSDSDVMEASQRSEGQGKGRKNIRRVIKDEDVAEATRRAAREEDDRRKRIAEKQKYVCIIIRRGVGMSCYLGALLGVFSAGCGVSVGASGGGRGTFLMPSAKRVFFRLESPVDPGETSDLTQVDKPTAVGCATHFLSLSLEGDKTYYLPTLHKAQQLRHQPQGCCSLTVSLLTIFSRCALPEALWYNELYEIPENFEVLDKLVLDFDPETKEELVSVHPNLVRKLKPHQRPGKCSSYGPPLGSRQQTAGLSYRLAFITTHLAPYLRI